MLNCKCNLCLSLSCGFLAVYTDLAGHCDLADKITPKVLVWAVHAYMSQAGENVMFSAFESVCFPLRVNHVCLRHLQFSGC